MSEIGVPGEPVTEGRTGFRRLARQSAGYAIGAIVGKGVGILLLPLVTRALHPAEFGQWEVLSTMQSAVGSLLLLGIETGSTRLYADLDDDERRRMFSTWALMSLALTLVTALLFWSGGSALSDALFDTTALATAVALVGVAVVGSTFLQVGLTVLRNHQRPGTFALASSIAFIAYGALVVVMVIRDATVTTMMVAMTGGFLVGAVVAMFAARTGMGGRPDQALARRLLHYGLPLVPAVVAVWATELATRTILLRTEGATQVGWLSLALRFASVGLLVVLAFQMAWQVEAFAIGHEESGRLRVAHDGRRILVTVCAASVAIAVLAPELIRILGGQAFAPALPAVCGALIFSIGFGAYHVATMPSAISGHMRDLGIAAIVGAVVSIGLTAVVAPSLASGGTAAAIAIGQFAAVGIGLVLGRRRTPVPFEWGRLGLSIVVSSAVIAAVTLPSGGAPPAIRIALFAAFVGYLFFEGTAREVTTAVTSQLAARRSRA